MKRVSSKLLCGVDRNAHLSGTCADAGRPVIADEALVLMHRDCVQVSEQSEWLAGSELRLKSLSAKERRLFKCVMLMEEFKLLNANMTPDSGRNDKETTTTIEEWSLIRNTAKEARIQKQMRKQKGRGQTSEEVICLMPGGEKAPTIFAQALV